MNSTLSGSIHDKTHILPVRVYFSDTDAGGVVYHSRYLDMAEHGRSELFHALGGRQSDTMKERKLGFLVRSLTVDYNRPAYLDDLLTVETKILRCETFKLQFDQKIMREGVCLASLKVKAGCISFADGRPHPMPEEWRVSIREMLDPALTE